MDIPKLVIISLIAGISAQLIKFIIEGVKGEFTWTSIREYGGMPSAHTAFVVSLTTAIGLSEGWRSPAFAISFIFSLLIIRDAIGLRRFLGQHGKVLNVLLREHPSDLKDQPKMIERIGHTPLQALVGGIIGFVLAWGLWYWLPDRWF